MLSIGLVASGRAAVDYFVNRAEGCGADYYTRPGQPRGRWVGSGVEAIARTGPMRVRDTSTLKELLDGVGPDGARLVPAVLRSDPRAQVPTAPLVAAVRAQARAARLPVSLLLDDRRLAATFARLSARTPGSGPRARGVRADVAVAMARAAGLDAHAVYREAFPARPGLLGEALRHLSDRFDVRRAGVDLTFSAPKSVSVLMAFAAPDVADEVRAAHAAAVDAAVGWLERTTAFAARGHHGDGQRASRVETHGFLGAAFEHATSRAGDPQLHTHVVLANLVQGVDGRWSALDTKALHRHGKTAGYLYQAVLRGELSRRLGVSWEDVTRGTAEITGVPRPLRRLFSKRAAQVEQALLATGGSGAKAAQAACLSTRPAKDLDSTPDDLRARWVAEALAAGHDPDQVVARSLSPGPTDADVDVRRLTERLLGPDGLTRQATTFDRGAVLRGVVDALPPGLPVEVADIEALAARVLADPRVVPVAAAAGTDEALPWSTRWTTTELLAVEEHALELAAALRASPCDPLAPVVVEWAIGQQNLGPDQAAMVRAVTGAGRLHVVVGPAGSGKTNGLAAASLAWKLTGRTTYGASLSALAARGLARSTAIPSTTVAQLLARLELTERRGFTDLTDSHVLVIDEAGMVGTRDLERLLDHAHRAGATVVLVGDPAQLPEIDAGGLFSALAERPSVELRDNHRQREAWEQTALTQLRGGQVDRALDSYLAHGRVHIATDTATLRDRVVADYLQHSEAENPAGVAILAATRHQVRAFNDAVRDRLTGAGLLTGPELVVATDDGSELRLQAGDRVLVTRNDYREGLLNGQHATVTSVDPDARSVTIATPEGSRHQFPHEWLAQGRLDHGYALTCHKAQGQTLEVTLVAGSSALTAETGYVALSRGRAANHLYLAPEPGSEDPAQEWLTDTVLGEVSHRLGLVRAQAMAVSQVAARRPGHTLARPTDPTAVAR